MNNLTNEKAAGLVNQFGRTLEPTAVKQLHPLDDPEVWRDSPMFDPPSDVNIAAEQKRIDDLMGTTRNNQSIYKLVWSGDMSFWNEVYTDWNALGHPIGPVHRWPNIRHGTVRNKKGKGVQHIFPPRWIVYSRMEPEQYAEHWKRESWVWAPEINCNKQFRPDEPPPVFWLWYMTICSHNEYCCTSRKPRRCFGEYAPPKYAYETLGVQKLADQSQGQRTPFEKIDYQTAREIDNANNGYEQEVQQLQVESEVYIENPMSLIGIHAGLASGITPKKARQLVKDYYDKKLNEQKQII